MIRIVHAADLHLGLSFSRYPPVVQQTLKDERMRALQSVVERANGAGAHALVIAGDLFDHLRVQKALVVQAKSVLDTFDGEVLVIPGNHDFYDPADDKCWRWFEEAPGSRVHLLHRHEVFDVVLADRPVAFYPCGCGSKHSEENLLPWVAGAAKESGRVHIGIAHGNVDGHGLDEEGRYFNMSEKELRDAGMNFWLLGHIHAPWPAENAAADSPYYFSGNHCAESWKSGRPGGSWFLEVDEQSRVTGTRWHHDGVRFADHSFDVNSAADCDAALARLDAFDREKTILRATFAGALTSQESAALNERLTNMGAGFLHADVRNGTRLRITLADVEREFAEGTVPHSLLSGLARDAADDGGLCLQLAYQTIQSLR